MRYLLAQLESYLLSLWVLEYCRDALLLPGLARTLLNYRGIRQNSFHSETYDDNKEEYLLFTICNGYGKHILYVSLALHYTYYKTRSTCYVRDSFPECLLHDKLGIPALVIIDIGLKPKLSTIPLVYDCYDPKF